LPHAGNTAVGLAADLHRVLAAGNVRWVESITPSPYLEDLFADSLRLEADGKLAIKDAPGLGFAWNPDGIARHTRGLALTRTAPSRNHLGLDR
jgi:L-alanine-DL-glutamate epimerase-like enolase superfamily enzyme